MSPRKILQNRTPFPQSIAKLEGISEAITDRSAFTLGRNLRTTFLQQKRRASSCRFLNICIKKTVQQLNRLKSSNPHVISICHWNPLGLIYGHVCGIVEGLMKTRCKRHYKPVQHPCIWVLTQPMPLTPAYAQPTVVTKQRLPTKQSARPGKGGKRPREPPVLVGLKTSAELREVTTSSRNKIVNADSPLISKRF